MSAVVTQIELVGGPADGERHELPAGSSGTITVICPTHRDADAVIAEYRCRPDSDGRLWDFSCSALAWFRDEQEAL